MLPVREMYSLLNIHSAAGSQGGTSAPHLVHPGPGPCGRGRHRVVAAGHRGHDGHRDERRHGRRASRRREAADGRHDRHGAGRLRLADPLPALHQRARHRGHRLHQRPLPLGRRRQGHASSSCRTGSTRRRRRPGDGPAPAPSRTWRSRRTPRSIRTYGHDPRLPDAGSTCCSKVKIGNIDFENAMDQRHRRVRPHQEAAARPRPPAPLPAGVGRHEHHRTRAEVDRGPVRRQPALAADQGQGLAQGRDPGQRLPGRDLRAVHRAHLAADPRGEPAGRLRAPGATTATSAARGNVRGLPADRRTSAAPGSRRTSRSARSARCTAPGSTGRRCRATRSTSSATRSRPRPAGASRWTRTTSCPRATTSPSTRCSTPASRRRRTRPSAAGEAGRRRSLQSPDLWTMAPHGEGRDRRRRQRVHELRWAAAAQNDFAARMQWTLTPGYRAANHAAPVGVASGRTVEVGAGRTVTLRGFAADPDGDRVRLTWWQYRRGRHLPGQGRDRCPGAGPDRGHGAGRRAAGPDDLADPARARDDGDFPLTRYARIILEVV